MHIEVTIENPGRTAVTGVVVRVDRIGPAGVTVPVDSRELELGPNATRALSTTWLAKGTGAHRLEVTVILADQSNSTNDLATATVTVTREGGTGDEGTIYIMTWAAVVVVVVLLAAYTFVRPRDRMRGD